MDKENIAFSFGRNWEDFIRTSFSSERVEIAKAHLLGFLERESLEGLYFLDVGCGSGIHSLAALRAGARKVVSFDVDEHSVQAATMVREMEGRGKWEILKGSVLDEGFLRQLEPADIVYSWGVLHHTGDMWTAVRNAAGLMRPRGLFYLALYTTTPRSDFWLSVKKTYNRSSKPARAAMEYAYALQGTILPELIRFRNPWRIIRDYKKSRGMSFMTDVRDWLGGYPFEHASAEEVLRFGRKSLGLELVNIKTGEANTEYLFKRG